MAALQLDDEWLEFERSFAAEHDLPSNAGPEDIAKALTVYVLSNAPASQPYYDPRVSAHDETLPSDISVRVYTPPDAEGKTLPLIVFFHGGGWLAGNLDTEDHICRTMSAQIPAVVVSVGYQLFPAVKYGEILDQCYTAYLWAYANASRLQADATRMAVCGGSAGGCLAVSVAYRLVSNGHGDKIKALLPYSAVCLPPALCPEKYKKSHVSYVELGNEVPVVRWSDCETVYSLVCGYTGSSTPAEGTTSFPDEWFPAALGETALKQMPRTYIFNSGLECVRDDGLVLEMELKDAGVDVKRDVMEGLPHYFFAFPLVERGKEFRRLLVEGAKWALQS